MARAPATLHHVGLVVPDLEGAMAEMSRLFGLEWTEPQERPDGDRTLRVAFSLTSPRIELVQGNPGGTWSTEGGPRLDHLAFWIDDFDATAGEAEAMELEREAGGTASWGGQWSYVRMKEAGTRVELCDARGKGPFKATWKFEEP